MRQRTLALLVIGVLAMMPVAAHAQRDRYDSEIRGPEATDWEFTLSGSGVSSNDLDNTNFATTFSLGYYLTDAIEPGVRQSIIFADNNDDSSTSGSTRGFIDYNFDLGALRPFVGASLGAVYGDGVDNDHNWTTGVEAGIKWYVLAKTFLYGIAEYQWEPEESFSDNGSFFYGVGIGFNF
ncbi:MAG: hypothetical protein IT445_10855 [Phycisphaeraceae bacterium]|nr:hypothetical protein [Phycisphaeraceae bacterium]